MPSGMNTTWAERGKGSREVVVAEGLLQGQTDSNAAANLPSQMTNAYNT